MRVLVGVLTQLRNMYTVHLIVCSFTVITNWYLHTASVKRPWMTDYNVVFLDFARAFDRISHVIILQKLCNSGIFGSLLNWCRDYLTERYQRVVMEG